jgi:hypothetical protein
MDTPLEPQSITAMKAEIDGICRQFELDEIGLEEFVSYVKTRFESAVKDVHYIPGEAYMVGAVPMLLSRSLAESIKDQKEPVRGVPQIEIWFDCAETLELTATHLPQGLQPIVERTLKIIYLMLDAQLNHLFPNL